MKFRVTQSIRIEANSYEEVGKLLDTIDKNTKAAFENRGMKGKHDFTGFDTQPCKAAVFDSPHYDSPPQMGQPTEGDF